MTSDLGNATQWLYFGVLLAVILIVSYWAWRQEMKVEQARRRLIEAKDDDAVTATPAPTPAHVDAPRDLSNIKVGSPEFYRLSKRQRRRLRREQLVR